MMKQAINHVKGVALALLVTAALAACSSDDLDGADPAVPDTPQRVTVALNIGVQEAAQKTRAWSEEQSENQQYEKMYSWFTVAVNSDNVIAAIVGEDPIPAGQEDAEKRTVDVTLDAGTYTFYSFANIDQSEVLGGLVKGSTVPENYFESKTFTVEGNGFAPSKDNPIPMSNRQQNITVTAGGLSEDLWVVRMLAKMEFQFYNSSTTDRTVNSITLSDLTANETDNLLLMPLQMDQSSSAACTPNLNGTPSTTNYTYTPSSALTIAANTQKAAAASVVFYVNESLKPTIASGLFRLAVETNGDVLTRYALITNADGNWDFIARNDHRIIPINLANDYQLDFDPKDFPAIGVLPSWEKNGDGQFTITFHDWGHFHLTPVVRKISDGSIVSYNASADGATEHWSFNGTYTGTYWDVFGVEAAPATEVPAGFYTDDNADVPSDETCYKIGRPKWVPAAGYIAGYLEYADEGDRQIAQHTLTIQVYPGAGVTAQELKYTLYMVKDISYDYNYYEGNNN